MLIVRLERASDTLREQLDLLSEALAVLPAGQRRRALWGVSALRWNVVEGPGVAWHLAAGAADRLGDAGNQPWTTGGSIGEHPSQQFVGMRDAGQLSRLALESGVHYLHASGDLLAQLVRTSLRLCDNERCGLAEMLKPPGSRRVCTRTCLVDRPQAAQLRNALAAYHDSPQYRYVEAVGNRLKHRNLCPRAIRAVRDWGSDEVAVSQGFRGFSHNGGRIRAASLADLAQKTGRLQERARRVVYEVFRLV